MSGPEYLNDIKKQLKEGRNAWRRADNIFRAFGYVRRRQTAVDLINSELAACGLRIEPPLSTTIPLSSYVRFFPVKGSVTVAGVKPPPVGSVEAEPVAEVPPAEDIVEEPPAVDESNTATHALIVGNLAAAENKPVSIAPDAEITEAITLMDLKDFSQLVVASTPSAPKGIVSYKSIVRARIHGEVKTVNDALDELVPRVDASTPLLTVIEHFEKHDAVLVIGPDKSVRGIVTPADIAIEFSSMAGPFLLVGQIEEQLRWLVKRWLERDKVTLAAALKLESQNGTAAGAPAAITDLTMGELHWILSAPDNWKGIGIPYDRAIFCKEFDAIREIRNAVMHFRDLDREGALKRVQDFAAVVQRAYVAATT